ncbi:MAG: hypothetical protein LBP76_15200 [Treponema sp.]|jgi:hypothetical protein|nr:hypothetical protein [Treponema sp.]
MKKKIGIALLAIILVGGLIFAVDNCKYYSTNPGGGKLSGLRANISSTTSGTTVSISSSIKEPVKITSVKIGKNEYVWSASGNKRLDAYGDTTLTISEKTSGSIVVEAESCD